MKNYQPLKIGKPRTLDLVTAWGGIPPILEDILDRFNVKRDRALEFGVEGGYSISALSNFFKMIYGVDTFQTSHTGLIPDMSHPETALAFMGDVISNLEENGFKNVFLIRSLYEDFIEHNYHERFDLIHVDLFHSYREVIKCGSWSIERAPVVLIHDTISFPETMQACERLAAMYNLEFYNYEHSNGLGILVRNG